MAIIHWGSTWSICYAGELDTFYLFNEGESKYDEIKEYISDSGGLEKIDYVKAHNIIFAGIEFAEDHGFKPHKDFINITRYILEEDNDNIELIEIECGHDGYAAVTVFEENREEAEKQIRLMQNMDYPEDFLVFDMINEHTLPGSVYFDTDYDEDEFKEELEKDDEEIQP